MGVTYSCFLKGLLLAAFAAAIAMAPDAASAQEEATPTVDGNKEMNGDG